MNTITPAPVASWLPSAAGRDRMRTMRGEPLFIADWDRALMLHYEVSPAALQPFVPFELDVRDGKAYVGLVAFTMRGLRLRRGGRVARALLAPIATHDLLNLRTYVKHRGEPGIFFLAEWLPNALSVPLGRPVFGLPYRLGKLHFNHEHERGWIEGKAVSGCGRGTLRYRAQVDDHFSVCDAGSLTEFLMERYAAFTEWFGFKRRFRVWHQPWRQCAVEAEIGGNTLMELAGSWARKARFVGANYSPGVRGVWMGRPVFAGNDK